MAGLSDKQYGAGTGGSTRRNTGGGSDRTSRPANGVPPRDTPAAPSLKKEARKKRTYGMSHEKARLLVAMWNGRWSKSEKGKYNRNIR
ncbi:hypothetical protein HPB50_018510 [Hyalomma asiaticum]|uniref:Uncharacterized protein n=1 Tax=Hyalomma asiaticum TaxID=266040 RepID=A0ACB7TII2_HYAAI|nr:hypothetical protein HPB50_018510 [Hyalomma asiaticum]